MENEIGERIRKFHKELPAGVKLVAVSKFHPAEAVQAAYDAGQRIFGESRVQEFLQKRQLLPQDIEWHFIGHLQTNKVRQVVPYISLIHSVDSIKLLRLIDEESLRIGKVTDVLLQLHVAKEEAKFGFTVEECLENAASGAFHEMDGIRIRGVMGMATNTDDENEIRKEFADIRHVFDRLRKESFAGNDSFTEVSMGMSDDYPLAVAGGSTMVRIGSVIFGMREY